MKILIISLAGIGDSLMLSPALKVLRENKPHAEIHVITMLRGAYEIYSNNRDINKLIHFDFLNEGYFKSLRFVYKMRKEKYDLSINVYPMNRREYNFISFLIGAKERLGHYYNHQNLRNLNFLHTKYIKEDDTRHNVEENIELLSLLGINAPDVPPLNLKLPEENPEFSKRWFAERKIDERDLVIGFHAGSATLKNHIQRRWNPDNFASLGTALIEKYNAKILIFGGPEEQPLKKYTNEKMNKSGFTVDTESLFDTIYIMKYCRIFITNDSALMHIAAALNLNTIALFGPTHEEWVHPWNTTYKIVRSGFDCDACFYYSTRPLTCKYKDTPFACIRSLTVDDVLQHTNEFLKEINIKNKL
ncbi:glycosyltransferase family 9 protein [candidate division KSB1 bacterium]